MPELGWMIRLGMSSVLVMLALDFDVQQGLMIIALSPCLLQPPHFVVLQSPSNSLLKFLSAYLLLSLFFFRCFKFRLEARLHTYPKGGVECYSICVASNFWYGACF
jgi:hypothetical protein